MAESKADPILAFDRSAEAQNALALTEPPREQVNAQNAVRAVVANQNNAPSSATLLRACLIPTTLQPRQSLTSVHGRLFVDTTSSSPFAGRSSAPQRDKHVKMYKTSEYDSTQDSGFSGLSSLEENVTDDFVRKMADVERQRRDHKRIQDATSGAAPAFRLARPRPRLSSYLEKWDRNLNQRNSQLDNTHHLERGAVNLGPDTGSPSPPAALRQWGTKGRRGADYLKRLGSASAGSEATDGPQRDTELPRRALFSGEHPYAKTSDIPLATTEDVHSAQSSPSPIKMRRSPNIRRRSSMFDSMLRREKHGSPASQPSPVPKAEPQFDATRRDEIDRIRSQAIATSRLEDTRLERKPQRSIAFRNSDSTLGNILGDLNDESGKAPKLQPATPDAQRSEFDRSSPSPRVRPDIPPRTTSRDLLKQLARASSATPSPHARPRNDVSRRASNRRHVPGDLRYGPLASPDVKLDPRRRSHQLESPSTQRQSVQAHLPTPPAEQDGDQPIFGQSKARVDSHAGPGQGTNASRSERDRDLMQYLSAFEPRGELKVEDMALIRQIDWSNEATSRDHEAAQLVLCKLAGALLIARSELRVCSTRLLQAETMLMNGQRQGSDSHPVTIWTVSRDSIEAGLSYLFEKPIDSRWPRLNAFGIGVACFMVWSITEVSLCEYYCQPTYARSMIGYGVNYDAVEKPFVTMTVLARPLKWLWKPLFGIMLWLWHLLLGVLVRLLFGSSRQLDGLRSMPSWNQASDYLDCAY